MWTWSFTGALTLEKIEDYDREDSERMRPGLGSCLGHRKVTQFIPPVLRAGRRGDWRKSIHVSHFHMELRGEGEPHVQIQMAATVAQKWWLAVILQSEGLSQCFPSAMASTWLQEIHEFPWALEGHTELLRGLVSCNNLGDSTSQSTGSLAWSNGNDNAQHPLPTWSQGDLEATATAQQIPGSVLSN